MLDHTPYLHVLEVPTHKKAARPIISRNIKYVARPYILEGVDDFSVTMLGVENI